MNDSKLTDSQLRDLVNFSYRFMSASSRKFWYPSRLCLDLHIPLSDIRLVFRDLACDNRIVSQSRGYTAVWFVVENEER